MKVIGSVKEDLNIEKRISITPETTKKFADSKFSIFLEKNYGEHLGIPDKVYVNKGATFFSSAKEVIDKSDIILKVNSLSDDLVSTIKSKTIVIGQFDLFLNKDIINKLLKDYLLILI